MGKIVGLVFEDEPVYTCPHCGKVYKTEESLEKHLKDKHTEPDGTPAT